MNEQPRHFELSSRDPAVPHPVLVGMQAQGRLDAVLFELTLRQTYRNAGDEGMEVIYTFPLPPAAVLLGFASELNGQRQEGVVVAAPDAERQYEDALVGGDAPVMLETHGQGVHTACIGNLLPGDEVVLECRFVQLIGFEQGRLRLCLPTTLAPRYGQAALAGLQPQQVPTTSPSVEYPLSLALCLGPALAGAAVECPTHRMATHRNEEGLVQLELDEGARLDRDVVVWVTPREPHPSLLLSTEDTASDEAPVVRMATLQPRHGAPRERIAVKLLVDCSGSMTGDSIASARAALRGVVAGLGEQDQVSLSRFGSTVEHLCTLVQARPQTLRHLQPLIDRMQADLGGTEMERALNAVLDMPGDPGPDGADILLITDGSVWQTEAVVAAARSSGHRVFAIGVGSAPAEGLLRALAEATGGACEFATPGESLEAAARRMLHRMRQPIHANARIDWGDTPVWSSGPTHGVFGGDAVIAFAGFSRIATTGAVRLLADDAQGQVIELARSEAQAPCHGDALPRIAAARRLSVLSGAESLQLAVRYQLMSSQTRCILVHERASEDKALEAATLHRVGSMLAAGWGGMGTVRKMEHCVEPLAVCSVSPPMRSASSASIGACLSVGLIDPLQWPSPESYDKEPATLEQMARSVADHLSRGGTLDNLVDSCGSLKRHPDAQRALWGGIVLCSCYAEVWLLLAYWVCTHPGGLADPTLEALLRPWMSAFAPEVVAESAKVFERCLAGHPMEAWAAHCNEHPLLPS